MEVKDGHAMIKFDHSGDGLYGFDSPQEKGMAQVLKGFAIAGADKKFVNAKAKVVAPDTVEVWADDVKEPVAVRYAWADNPNVNLYSRGAGLPATPFRTDDWPGVTINNKK